MSVSHHCHAQKTSWSWDVDCTDYLKSFIFVMISSCRWFLGHHPTPPHPIIVIQYTGILPQKTQKRKSAVFRLGKHMLHFFETCQWSNLQCSEDPGNWVGSNIDKNHLFHHFCNTGEFYNNTGSILLVSIGILWSFSSKILRVRCSPEVVSLFRIPSWTGERKSGGGWQKTANSLDQVGFLWISWWNKIICTK